MTALKLDEPNLRIPLAASYNERKPDGYATTVTSGKDQRKINSRYELVSNPVSGRKTLYLSKRPGIPDAGLTLNGTLDQQDLIIRINGPAQTNNWVFGCIGDDTKVTNISATTTIHTVSGGLRPRYVDKTIISGTQYVVVQLGTSNTQVVYYASAIGAWTQISDADFPTLSGKMEFMDGYAFALSSTNKVHNSDVNSLANWAATSFLTKDIITDSPLGLAKLGRILLAFGSETVEAYYNAGNTSGSPLGRIPQLATGIGISSKIANSPGRKHYYATHGGKLYFLGTANAGGGSGLEPISLFMFDGSRFERVSSRSIDKILAGAAVYDVQHVEIGNDSFIGISLTPSSTATQRWLCFYPEWNDWFEWTNTYVQLNNSGEYFVGMPANPTKLGTTNISDSWVDGVSTAYTMTHQFKLPQSGADRKRMHFAGVIGDTQTSASDLSISFSDDDYQTFSTARTIDLTKDKKQIYRCGSYRGRAVKLEHSANTDCRIESFIARVE